ncbi:MAG TPA: tRNA-dihydrouridine synthase [Pirellulales bacterium]|jgi:nifR3 family TIM-barrel protein|nr:tRNA-dihydrouridine synthase [Pirellulales bacterium]
MKIGQVRIAHSIALAPMEEHTNYPFRLLMKQFGASLVCTERVDATDVARRDRRALRLLYTTSQEAPRAGQISGADPVVMAEAARVVEEQGFDLVDLNFECPIRRLLARGEGGALLADPSAVGRIVAAVAKAVSIPLTLKIRSGPDAERETAADVARAAEGAGAAAVEVHARSVAQAYVGGPDWSVVERVKRAVAIPVFGSGGIRHALDAVKFLRASGADGASIGRGCLGNPWIFRQARALVQGGAAIAAPSLAERGRVLVQLAEAEFRLYGANLALRRLPRASCYFAKALPDFASFRDAIRHVRSLYDLRQIVKEHFV